RPVRLDALLLEPRIRVEQVTDVRVRVSDVIDADVGALARRRAGGLQRGEVHEGDAMMLLVVREEGQDGILVAHVRLEAASVPVDHLVEAARAIDDVGKFRRSCHEVLLKAHDKPRGKTETRGGAGARRDGGAERLTSGRAPGNPRW